MAECGNSLIGVGVGFFRVFFIVVSHVALRRAKLWSMPAEDLYASVFRCMPCSRHTTSWISPAGRLMKRPWYVRSRCRELSLPAWAAEAGKSTKVPPYLSFQPCHSALLQLVSSLPLCWEDRQSIRSFVSVTRRVSPCHSSRW